LQGCEPGEEELAAVPGAVAALRTLDEEDV
jgi:hypothetical protein